jgi:hypothetical protein
MDKKQGGYYNKRRSSIGSGKANWGNPNAQGSASATHLPMNMNSPQQPRQPPPHVPKNGFNSTDVTNNLNKAWSNAIDVLRNPALQKNDKPVEYAANEAAWGTASGAGAWKRTLNERGDGCRWDHVQGAGCDGTVAGIHEACRRPSKIMDKTMMCMEAVLPPLAKHH